MKLPNKLCRKAIKNCFPKVSEATWDYLFDYEKQNGLFELRVPGDYKKLAYYKTSGLMDWLVHNGHYTPVEFDLAPRMSSGWGGLITKTHALI